MLNPRVLPLSSSKRSTSARIDTPATGVPKNTVSVPLIGPRFWICLTRAPAQEHPGSPRRSREDPCPPSPGTPRDRCGASRYGAQTRVRLEPRDGMRLESRRVGVRPRARRVADARGSDMSLVIVARRTALLSSLILLSAPFAVGEG